jgi:hypothetical protein
LKDLFFHIGILNFFIFRAKEFPKYEINDNLEKTGNPFPWKNFTKKVFGERLNVFKNATKFYDPLEKFKNNWVYENILQE